MPELSIISVAVESPEWAELLIKSIRKYTILPHEIIIIDNGSQEDNLATLRQMAKQGWIKLVENGENRGHGGAIDQGVVLACGRYVCVTDIDSHFQREGWDADLLALYQANPQTRLIGMLGPDHKPLHPPLFFFERDFILDNKLTFRYMPGVEGSTDTAQKVYWDILGLGFHVERLPKGPKIYGDTSGDEIWIGGKPTLYHHWNGTRFLENRKGGTKQELDGIKLEDHLIGKAKLFQQPLVQEILKSSELKKK